MQDFALVSSVYILVSLLLLCHIVNVELFPDPRCSSCDTSGRNELLPAPMIQLPSLRLDGQSARVFPVTNILIGSFVMIVVLIMIIVISWYAGYSYEVQNEHY